MWPQNPRRYFTGDRWHLISSMEVEILPIFLSISSDLNERDNRGKTPLMDVVRYPEAFEVIRHMVSHGADVNAMADERTNFRTVLHYAVMSGDPRIVDLLLSNGAIPRYPPGIHSMTPLHMAITHGLIAIVKMLINAGANVNSPTPILGTPLHVACCDDLPDKLDVVESLLSSGANPNIVILYENGRLLRPVLSRYLSTFEHPCPLLVTLLLKYGAKVSMKEFCLNPNGILDSLRHVVKYESILNQLVNAADDFDVTSIQRNRYLLPEQKSKILSVAFGPRSLKHLSRQAVRKFLGWKAPSLIDLLHIPQELKNYLAFS